MWIAGTTRPPALTRNAGRIQSQPALSTFLPAGDAREQETPGRSAQPGVSIRAGAQRGARGLFGSPSAFPIAIENGRWRASCRASSSRRRPRSSSKSVLQTVERREQGRI